MANHNYGMGRGYIPTNIAPTTYSNMGNYGSAVQPVQSFQQMYPNYNANNMNPTQFNAITDSGFNPVTGERLQPQSLADMTGLQRLSAGMSMAGNLANIWSGIQQNNLARDNFNFQKGVMNTNLANQIASYNTALEDRVAGRYSDRERTANQTEINDYLDRSRAVNRMG